MRDHECLNDEDVHLEYGRLHDELDRQGILAFAQLRSGMLGLPVSQLEHVATVGALAGSYVSSVYAHVGPVEQMYRARVCEAVGYLHEAMVQGCSFEDIVLVSDEQVARLVAHITPDIRLARPKRLMMLSNQIGLAPVDAQMVKLADLRCECDDILAIAESNPAAARQWYDNALPVVAGLAKLRNTPLEARLRALKACMNQLDDITKRARKRA